jgi:hypothetical protein
MFGNVTKQSLGRHVSPATRDSKDTGSEMSTFGGNLAGHGRMFVTANAVVLMSISGFVVYAADPSEVSRVASI